MVIKGFTTRTHKIYQIMYLDLETIVLMMKYKKLNQKGMIIDIGSPNIRNKVISSEKGI